MIKTQSIWSTLCISQLHYTKQRLSFTLATKNLPVLEVIEEPLQYYCGTYTDESDTVTEMLQGQLTQSDWRFAVMQFPLLPASDIFGLQTLGRYSCQGRRQHWGWGVLRSPAHASGTVCQLPFEPQRFRLWRSPDISWATCLIDWQRLWGLFRTRFTNLRIIIIIIIIIIVHVGDVDVIVNVTMRVKRAKLTLWSVKVDPYSNVSQSFSWQQKMVSRSSL